MRLLPKCSRRFPARLAPLLALAALAGCHPWPSAATDGIAADPSAAKHRDPKSLDKSSDSSANETQSGESLNRTLSKPAAKNADAKPPSAVSGAEAALANPYWNPAQDPRRPLRMCISRHSAIDSKPATSICLRLSRRRPPPIDRSQRVRQKPRRACVGEIRLWKNSLPIPESRPDLHRAIASTDPATATNAAIVLAREHDPAARDPLRRAIDSPETNLWQRRAAIEAWGQLAVPGTVAQLHRWIDQFGDYQGTAANYVPELHAEALRALVQNAGSGGKPDADCERQLVEAVGSPAAMVRREALAGLADARLATLPPKLEQLAADLDPTVRQAGLLVLAARRHPEALDRLGALAPIKIPRSDLRPRSAIACWEPKKLATSCGS